MTNRKCIFMFFLIQTVFWTSGVARAECMISATIRPTKAAYVESEPVELTLTLTNQCKQPARISARYPSFEGFNDTGIQIAVEGAQSAQQVRSGRELPGRASVLTIEPLKSWSVRVYLQDYAANLKGDYQLSYSIAIPRVDENFRRIGTIQGHGTFQVSIRSANERELSRTLGEYSKELDSADYWTQRTAIEALSVTTSPVVIPYLQKVIDVGFTDIAFRVLRKFRGNHEAEQVLVNTVRNGRLAGVTGALTILESWNYALAEGDFAYTLGRNGSEMKLAMMRYAGKMLNTAYRPAIALYLADPDPKIAAEAKRMKELLDRSLN